MLYTKLLMRRLACMSWLLVVGLVLGWSGKVAAQDVSISLAANPTVINEDAGATDVVVTATLEGEVFNDDVVVFLVTDEDIDGNVARRDVDYTAILSNLTISAGSASGTTTVTITPYNDKRARGDKTIRLTGWYADNTVGTVDITLKDAGASSVLSFDGDAAIYDQIYIVGRAITEWLPEALGGIGNLTYSLLSLPAGLEFDASTRTLSGTPTTATDGAVAVTYRVTDESGATITRTFTITVVNGVGDATVSLTVNPSVISEDAGPTNVVVTGTLEGEVFDEDVTVFLTFDNEENIDKAARRDVDYTAILSPLTIRAGSVSGTTTITITPYNDKRAGGDKTIRLRGAYANTVGNRNITLKDADASSSGSALSFFADAPIDDQTYIVGTAITALVLPKASGGTAPLTYSLLSLPAGLEFDATTRTLSGTPSAATDGAVAVTYRVTDADGTTDRQTFAITIIEGVAEVLEEPEESEEPEEPEEPEDSSQAFDDDAVIDDQTEEKSTPTVELDGISSSHTSVRENDEQATVITLTVTLDKTAAIDEKITLAIVTPTQGKAAKHDEDFDATLEDTLTIAKGQRTGTAQLTLTPKDNTTADSDKAFAVQATSSSGHRALINIKIVDDEMEDEDDSEEDGEVDDSEVADSEDDGGDDGEDDGEGDGDKDFGFAEEVEEQAYTAETAITPLVLPEASGGTGTLTYRLVGLPAGLAFDASTRTISGTPSAATDGAVEVTYIVTDEGGAGAFLIFSITVNPPLSFGDLFNFG